MRTIIHTGVIGIFLFLLVACSSESDPLRSPKDIKVDEGEDGEKIVIVDWRGEEWEITHAVKAYGFDP
ncbi:MAG: hypothetical protein D6732_05820, partial [Methanobacteriota archaeon]